MHQAAASAIAVLTYGTFDLFHYGHLCLLQRARALGDRLVVGVVSDRLCIVKGKRALTPEAQRAAIVEALRCVDEVFIQTTLDLEQKERDIDRFTASVLVVGDDWKEHPRFVRLDGYNGVEVVYLERTPGISSTEIKRRCAAAGGA